MPRPRTAPKNEMHFFRERLDLTQSEAAALLGCKPTSIQAIELGKLKISPSMELRMVSAASPERASALIEQKVAKYRADLIRKLTAIPPSLDRALEA